MVNHEIISLMKRRIDELNDEEFSIIRNYVEQRVRNAHTKQANKTCGEMLGGRKTVKLKNGENQWFSRGGVTEVTPFPVSSVLPEG